MQESEKKDSLNSTFENLAEDDETRWIYNAQRQLNKFACELVTFRIDKGWNQKELADYLGVSQSTLTEYENGNYNISIDTLNRLASKIGLNVDICFS